MKIKHKPNYIHMPIPEYQELVFAELESKMTFEGMGLLALGVNARLVSLMIFDACVTFKNINLSPRFTACQIIELLVSKSIAAGKN